MARAAGRAITVIVWLWLAASACAQTAPPPPPPDLTMPTTFYIVASAIDWSTAAPACQIGCQSRTGLLPGVDDARVSVPIGIGLDIGVLWVTHKFIAKRHPKFAEGLLYALTIVRAVNASDHLIVQRDFNRRSKGASVSVTIAVPAAWLR